MWKATVKGILARKVRLRLTALAVLLGVSFVSGTYVLTDTLDRSFQGLFAEFGSGIDLVVRHQAPFGGDSEPPALLRRDVVDDVRAVDGVSTANGVLFDYAQFVDRDGDNIQTGGAPTIGITWAQQGREGPLRLVRDGDRRGHPPSGRHQVAMDVGTAREYGFHVGDRVRVLLEGPAETFRIVGLFTFGDQRELGAVTFAAFDVETAESVFDAPDLVDAINVTAEPGVSPRQLRSRIQASIGPTYEVQSAADVRRGPGACGPATSSACSPSCSWASPRSGSSSARSSSSTRSRSSSRNARASSDCCGRWGRAVGRWSPRSSSRPPSWARCGRRGCRRRARSRRGLAGAGRARSGFDIPDGSLVLEHARSWPRSRWASA